MSDIGGLIAVFVLVAANGFFVAAEFSLVAVRRSRVVELIAEGRMNAGALDKALGNLDANLAATQLGITISSLGLGWVGEPALAHLIQPLLGDGMGAWAGITSYTVAVAFAFIVITTLHIVLGELAPKSLALQRSEGTALWVVRPLTAFLWLLRPAIFVLNGLGNLVLRLCGLRPGTGEGSLHSASELKLLVAASQDAGLLQAAQEEVVMRALDAGNRRVGDIMTPRTEVDWIDFDDSHDEVVKTLRESRHEQLLVSRGNIDELVGAVSKRHLLNQLLAGSPLDLEAVIGKPLLVHEATPVFKVLDDWGTVTMPGCFAASLERHKAAGTSPKMLWQHDQTQPIGAWSDVAEDDTGLRCAGNLILDVAKAVEAHALLKAGAIDGLSIGFQLISGEEVSAADAEAEGIDTSSGYRTEDGTIILMREIDVQEISLVTFQSCAEATVDGVRVKTIPAA
ncbi:MAG: HK97 family phage prohead protease, partial [Proteobacteria bacterium]|nr:HK97 family phage prohead protease [Pseudomonadota bacterium]